MRNTGWVVGLIVGAVAGCGAPSSKGGGGDGKGALVYSLDYAAGSKSLLDFRIDVDLALSSVDGRPLASLLDVGTAGVARASSRVNGSNQQRTEFTLSSGDAFLGVPTFSFDFEFSRAGSDGDRFDAGEPIHPTCYLGWDDPTDVNDLSGGADCEVTRTGERYTATLDSALITVDGADGGPAVLASGTVSFSPVPVRPIYVDVGCASEEVCLSLDGDPDPHTGWCVPEDNLRSSAQPCDSECGDPLTFGTGDEEVCVCSSPCGARVGGGGVETPTCDPAYGCIDF